MNLAPPKIVAENKVNISHIHCMEQASERSKPGLADIAADCSAPCGPIWPKFYVMNGLGFGYKRCEFCWAGLRYAGAAAEKLAKTVKNRQFLSGFQPMLLRTLTHPNRISIVCSHTLARSPCKVSSRSAHRGPSNRP